MTHWRQFILDIVNIIRKTTELHEQIDPTIYRIIKNNWGLPKELPISTLSRIHNYHGPNINEKLDVIMCESLRRISEGIIADAYARFPWRGRYLSHAYAAHKKGKYIFSVPVFLSQMDGMCWDLFGFHLFHKSLFNRVSEINNIHLGIYRKMFTPLQTEKIAAANTQNSIKFDGKLNRHTIMHGMGLNYETEINILKCISLIGYLAFLVDTLTSNTIIEQANNSP